MDAETEFERKRLDQQLHQAQKMEAIGRLAGGIAHDFNNLLTTILGYSDLLLDQLDEKSPLWRDVVEIKKAGERAGALTRQLLAFSRRQILAPQVLDLNSLVGDLRPILRRLVGEDIELVTAVGPAVGSVKADPSQIEQVVMNLVLNARDAMPLGGTVKIEIANVVLDKAYAEQHAGAQPGQYVLLAISDTGCGMDEETQNHMFDPFFTTKEPGKGTGLGLSTVYGIVKQSGGYILVSSKKNRGTIVNIHLPLVDEAAPATPASRRPVEPTQGSQTILLVEDQEGVRDLSRRILEREGYTVLQARDGNEAIFIAAREEGPIDLLVTDVVMPGLRGPELAERLASVRSGIKVLFVSGYPEQMERNFGAISGGNGFLHKPFTAEALVRRVRELLGA